MRNNAWRFVFGMICGMLLMLTGQLMASHASLSQFQGMALLQQVMKQIRFYYVDDKSEQELIDTAIEGMLGKLDPYSSLLDTDQLESLYNSTTGEYRGIGIEVSYEDNEVKVIAPIFNSPAYRAGIRSGDTIVSCNGVALSNTDIKFVHQQIKTASDKITFEIKHQGSEIIEKVVLEPELITIDSVAGAMVSDTIGYARIHIFQEQTRDQLQLAIRQLRRDHPKLAGLIIDLRDNPGGVLNAAIEVSDLFLSDGLIVSTQGRYIGASFDYFATDSHSDIALPLTVLINHGSASASEILAAALQQNQRARLLGETSFGKGLIQSLIPLDDLNMTLKMTTARYYTPNGESIHGKGVTPDISYTRHQLSNADKSPIISPTSSETAATATVSDPLVRRAIQLLSAPGATTLPALTRTQ